MELIKWLLNFFFGIDFGQSKKFNNDKDHYGNTKNRDVHGNPRDRDVHGNRTDRDVYGNRK